MILLRLLRLFIKLIVVVVQNKKREANAISYEALLVVTMVSPAIHASRVASGKCVISKF